MAGKMLLEILSPEKGLFNGEVNSVTLPGRLSPFVVLYNHAPLISELQAGRIVWLAASGNGELEIGGGFVQVLNNRITVCVEQ